MKKEVKFVDINEVARGAQVMDLTPDYERPLALVDLDVLKRLADLLPKGNLYEIVEKHITDVRDAQNIQEFAGILAEELAFHQTVNLIQEYRSSQPKVVGKVDLENENNY